MLYNYNLTADDHGLLALVKVTVATVHCSIHQPERQTSHLQSSRLRRLITICSAKNTKTCTSIQNNINSYRVMFSYIPLNSRGLQLPSLYFQPHLVSFTPVLLVNLLSFSFHIMSLFCFLSFTFLTFIKRLYVYVTNALRLPPTSTSPQTYINHFRTSHVH